MFFAKELHNNNKMTNKQKQFNFGFCLVKPYIKQEKKSKKKEKKLFESFRTIGTTKFLRLQRKETKNKLMKFFYSTLEEEK